MLTKPSDVYIPSFIIDAHGTIQGMNQACASTFGLCRDSSVGEPLSSYIFGAEGSSSISGKDLLRSLSSDTRNEVRIGTNIETAIPALMIPGPKDRDGNRTVHCFSHKPGSPSRSSGICRYLADNHVQDIFRQFELGIGLYDPSGNIIAFNDHAAEVMGTEPSALVGKNLREIFPPDLAEVYSGRIDAVLQASEAQRYFDKVVINGEDCWFQTVYSKMTMKENQPPVVRIVSQDITDQKNDEMMLIEAKKTAESANRIKERILNNVSHEMRTPLNGIMGMLTLLHEENPREDQLRLINEAVRASRRMLKIVEDLLETSLLSQGQLNREDTLFDLVSTVRRSVEEHRDDAEKKGLDLLFHSECKELWIIQDQEMIRRIIRNLMTNAVKFTEEGRIIVEIRADELLEISVSDTGIGLSETDLEQIFNPFVQLDNPYTKNSGGIGLGLSLTQSICLLIGAVLDVRTRPEKGSEFIVKFSRTDQDGSESQK